MMRYAYNPRPENSVKVYGRGLRISEKGSVVVCGALSGMNLLKGKAFLEGMASGKRNIMGKHYTNVSKELLTLLQSGESNAEARGLDTSRLVVHASAHRGFTFYRPRRLKFRRSRRKVTNVQIVMEQR
jgi:ribosomal protein L22